MVRVTFTKNLQRHVISPPTEVEGRTVREVLDAVFAQIPDARRYVLDEHGALRPHMTVFVGDRLVTDRKKLDDTVNEGEEIYVSQALSGG